MQTQLNNYLQSLKTLSSKELMASLDQVIVTEKKALTLVIAHLSEVAARKAHLDYGYKSLFEYAEQKLKLDPGCIYQRLQVAAAAQAYPELLFALAHNEISLSCASKICPYLKSKGASLITMVRHKSLREVDALLSGEESKAVITKATIKRKRIKTIRKQNSSSNLPDIFTSFSSAMSPHSPLPCFLVLPRFGMNTLWLAS